MNSGEYYGTDWYWDEDDNCYELSVYWYFERGYPEIPDSWNLRSIEVEEGGELDVSEGGTVWQKIERDGPPANLEEVDYL